MGIEEKFARVQEGLPIALFGLLGVFSVLILFYLVTKIMVLVANKFATKKTD